MSQSQIPSQGEKYVSLYSRFHTVVLLDEMCSLSNAAIRLFSLESCYRLDAIKHIILERTGDRAGSQ